MTVAKKSQTPPPGFKLAYARNHGESAWTRFGVQARAAEYLARCAPLDADIWVQYGCIGGRDVIYVRVK